MDSPIFMLAQDPGNECRDVIFQPEGNFRVKVICLDESDWTPNPEELQFFADNNGEKLLFETSNFNPEEPGLTIEAIRWYANYIGNPQMEIEAEMG